MLQIKNAVFGYAAKKEKKIVLDGLSFDLAPGKLLCILGANGVGKTTMYRTILGFQSLLGGKIQVDGRDIRDIPRRELAGHIAYVPQYHAPPFPYRVSDVVLMGRGSHVPGFSMPGKEDEEAAHEALSCMGILSLKDEIYTKISGGERQLVLIARALAQQAEFILMDEPASYLDYGNQIRLLGEIKKLAREGIGICFTTHYPDHAFIAQAHVLALEGKDRWREGPAEEIITEDLLKSMYGLDAKIRTFQDEEGGPLERQISVRIDP